jgi:hypothetical protein
MVRRQLPEARFVGPGEFARFVVDVIDGEYRAYGAAGLTLVDGFRPATPQQAATRLAGLFSRSLKASSLLGLTNPASGLEVEARIVGLDDGGTPRIRRAGEPRTHLNSLMIEIRTSADSYVTIVDVDAEGGINVLFPNAYSNEAFHPGGRITGGETVRIPDSLQSGNRAGFLWDYRPPAGLDTIQVFACTDLATAKTIRGWLGAGPATTTRGLASSKSVPDLERLAGLRGELSRRVRTRGVPAPGAEPDAATAAEEEDESPGTTEGPPAADWNATSIRIRVEQ